MSNSGPTGPSVTAATKGRASLPSPNPTKSFWQTSHPNPTTDHRSTASLPSRASVVVIGTGISGTFATHELLTQFDKVEVLVLEARTTCSAATGRNGGHLQPIVHAEPTEVIDFELRNFRHVEELIALNDIPCDFHKCPGAIGFWNKTYFEEAKVAIQQVSAQQRSALRVVEDKDGLDQLRLIGAVGAIVQEGVAASLSPYKLVTWLWQDMMNKYEGSGRLNLQTTTPVDSITTSSRGYVLNTPRGNVQAKHILFATNAYTSHLLPEFGDLIGPVQAEMSALTPPPGSPFRDSLMPKTYGFLGLPGMDRQMSDYLVQQPIRKDGKGGQLMFGGGRHKARGYGVGVSDDSYVDSGAEHHLRSLPEQLNLQSDLQSPSSEPLNIEASWTGIIGSSTDGYPWVGGVPSSPGLFICAGYSGHGMTNAGLCGRHAARLLMTSVDGKDWVQLQNIEVDRAEKGQGGYGVPRQYVISKERMEAVVQKVSRTEHKL